MLASEATQSNFIDLTAKIVSAFVSKNSVPVAVAEHAAIDPGPAYDTDEPPERLGVVGVAILATFTAFCAVVWFTHTPPSSIG